MKIAPSEGKTRSCRRVGSFFFVLIFARSGACILYPMCWKTRLLFYHFCSYIRSGARILYPCVGKHASIVFVAAEARQPFTKRRRYRLHPPPLEDKLRLTRAGLEVYILTAFLGQIVFWLTELLNFGTTVQYSYNTRRTVRYRLTF